MSYRISFPSLPPENEYPRLMDSEDVYEAVIDAVQQSIVDMGSEGYEPSDFLPDDYGGPDCDPEGEQWQEAAERAIQHRTRMFAPQVFNDLWIQGDDEIDNPSYSRLPDGLKIKLERVDDGL